jgi:CDP-diacylglycerol--glycerol-3-phosphate 3-phosphatidyltransferase
VSSSDSDSPAFASKQESKLRPLQQEITDLPNLITLARIGLIPFILIFIDNYSPKLSALSALIFAFAAATDALDGYLARRLGLVTVVGKFLDPLADKLIVLSTLVMLVAVGRAPAWLVVLLMSRELAITGLRAIASQEGFVISAGAGGKTKTALQLSGIIFLLFHFQYKIIYFNYNIDFHAVGIVLLYLSLVMSLVSAWEYFRFFAAAASKQQVELAAQGITRKGQKEKAKGKRLARRRLRRVRSSSKRAGTKAAGKRKGRRAER